MFKKLGITVCTVLLVLTISMATPATAEEEKVLNIYFWFEYLPDSIIKAFQKEKMTGRIPKWAGRDLNSRPFGFRYTAVISRTL